MKYPPVDNTRDQLFHKTQVTLLPIVSCNLLIVAYYFSIAYIKQSVCFQL